MNDEETTGLVIKKDVKTQLSEERKALLGLEIAAHTIRYDELEEAKKEATKDLTAKMKNERAEWTKKAKALRTGVLEEQVDCIEVQDFARNTVLYKRIDNGQIAAERPMEQGERQLSIDGVDGEKKAAPVVAIDKAKSKKRMTAEAPADEEKH